MEKFYVVTSKSPIRQRYLDFLANNERVVQLYNAFAEIHGIQAEKFLPTDSVLGIVPKGTDAEKFRSQLCKDSDGETGLRLFKKNSVLNRAWVAWLKENETQVLFKPRLGCELGIFGRGSTRLFSHEDTVYASLDFDRDFQDPPGFQEIPGSEFYKVMEAMDAHA